jgi:hypothetical protein
MTTKRILALILAGWAAVCTAAGIETSLRLDASSRPASSPHPWILSGVAAVSAAGAVSAADSADGSARVLVLEPARYRKSEGTDLLVHFDAESGWDETGRWRIEPRGTFKLAPADLAYMGPGAASFRAPGSQLVLYPEKSPLFGSGSVSGDFSLEFWLYPANVESGEILFLWKGARRDGTRTTTQQVSAIFSRNRMVFAFTNFFAPPGGGAFQLNLTGASLLVPRTWSHHLVRFDSSTGLVEYLMNGVSEAAAYATATGREGGAVHLPSVGTASPVTLGQNYTGLLDELRLSSSWVERPNLGRYGTEPGTAVSPLVDLGWNNTRLASVDAEIRTPGDSGAAFFYRVGDFPETWRTDSPEWRPFRPGGSLPETARGRYVQVRVELYPDPRGADGPILSSITLHFLPDPPPPPPGEVLALPGDGRITLRWSRVPEADLAGYLVYYGTSPGDYYGREAAQGPSPVDAVDTVSITLTGLTNGRLYYFAVASYDTVLPRRPGEFSREASARPARNVP